MTHKTHHKARKRFGQNFLVDQQIIAGIIDAIHPQTDERIVEIGPGLGALTRPLLQKLDQLTVIELDRDIVKKLKEDYPPNKLAIYARDALTFDYATLGNHLRIVGNLPYNISTPLLFHLSQYSKAIVDMHFMLQKEVVARMVASPATADYGRLSVMLQYRFEMALLFTVPAASFRPAPKVESAIVRMTPINKKPLTASNDTLFSQVVAAAFSQRRKTLRNSLSAFLTAEDFAHLDIDAGLRAENLTVAQFLVIANHIDDKTNHRQH